MAFTSGPGLEQPRTEGRERWLRALVGFQVAALSTAAFVPFGFDKPSSLGLDFGHFFLLAVGYLVAWLAGLVLAVRARRWGILAAQVALLAGWAAYSFRDVLVAQSASGSAPDALQVRREP